MVMRSHKFISILLLLAASAAQSADKGYIGISMAIDGVGVFWNPTLKSVKIAKVAPASPAALAGIVEGDFIVEVEGKQVAGAKAGDLKPYLERNVGEQLKLVIKSANGASRSVLVTVAPKPE